MPRRIPELSALAISKIKDNGRHPVGGVPGLYFYKRDESRSWVLRAQIRSLVNDEPVVKRRDIGLGSYPAVSVKQARDDARELLRQIMSGIDPVSEKRRLRSSAVKVKTFKQSALEFIEMKSPEWRNKKHGQQWANTLTKYAFPIIGQTPINEIHTGDVLAILRQELDDTDGNFWTTKTETAKRVRSRLEQILDWAKQHRSGENPARWRGHLEHQLPSPAKIAPVTHHDAMPYESLPSFFPLLTKQDGIAARALGFTILTCARSGETRLASWSEFDLNKRLWICPSSRTKTGVEHRVPLSDSALQILESIPKYAGSNYVFPGARGGPLSDMSLTKVLRRMGIAKHTVHGFRSTFRDWAAETTNFPREICEQCLAHKIAKGPEAAYQRGDFLAKRTELMQRWAEFCTQANEGEKP